MTETVHRLLAQVTTKADMYRLCCQLPMKRGTVRATKTRFRSMTTLELKAEYAWSAPAESAVREIQKVISEVTSRKERAKQTRLEMAETLRRQAIAEREEALALEFVEQTPVPEFFIDSGYVCQPVYSDRLPWKPHQAHMQVAAGCIPFRFGRCLPEPGTAYCRLKGTLGHGYVSANRIVLEHTARRWKKVLFEDIWTDDWIQEWVNAVNTVLEVSQRRNVPLDCVLHIVVPFLLNPLERRLFNFMSRCAILPL